MAKHVTVTINGFPTFHVGERTYSNGRIYVGLGTVKKVELVGAGKDNQPYPQIVVKPDNTRGLRYGNKAVIRYHGDDLANGIVRLATDADLNPKAATTSKKAAINDALNALKAAVDMLGKALDE